MKRLARLRHRSQRSGAGAPVSRGRGDVRQRARPAKAAKAAKAAAPAITSPPVDYARLVPSPVFVLSSERSGSTLLRALLDSHSAIHAPHELHLRQLKVQAPELATLAMADLGFRRRDLENLLWDRMLHLRLVTSGKQIIVDKTPHNLKAWRRIHDYWPDARFLFLFRHPQRIFESMTTAWPHHDRDNLTTRITRTLTTLHEATTTAPGLDVRYEELTGDPEAATRQICSYLGVAWEPSMLHYGEQRQFERGLGDWGDKITGGRILPDKPLPPREEIDARLLEVTRLAGYPV